MRWWCLAILLSSAHGLSADEAFVSFRSWLQGRGAQFGTPLTIGIDSTTGLRGLLATEDIADGSLIFSIPSSVILTAALAKSEGATFQKCEAGASSGDDSTSFLGGMHTALALFLLEHRSPGASWNPWITMLPESFKGFPLLFEEDDLKGLQASPLRKIIEMEQDAVIHDYGVAKRTWPDLALEDFQWARACVKSRVFNMDSLSHGGLQGAPSDQIITMVPLADFVNHPPDGLMTPNAAPLYDVSTGTFRFSATRDIPKGQGIYWDYGFQSNRNSLMRYGFTAEKRVPLTDMPLFFNLLDFPGHAGSAKNVKVAFVEEARRESLAMEEDGSVMHEFSLSLGGADAEKLLGHMRFMVFQPKDASSLAELCPGTYCRPISLPTERAAFKHLKVLLDKLTSSYGTSIQEDRELIDGKRITPSSGTQYHTLLVRYGEKNILRGFGNLLSAIDPLFDLSPWALREAIASKWNRSGSDIHKYIQENLTALVNLETLRWAKRKVRDERSQKPTS